MATRLSSACLSRFQALPHTSDGIEALKEEQQRLVRLKLLLELLAMWEPGLLDMVALIVLDQLEYVWIPPSPPRHLVGRAVYRNLLYVQEHIIDEWEAPDNEWCSYCQDWCEDTDDSGMCGSCAYNTHQWEC
jgi:hypothetical protein